MIFRFLQKILNRVLNFSTLISDLILAVGNLTKAVVDLTKSQIMMAKMQQEDRQKLSEVYAVIVDISNEIAVRNFETAAASRPAEQEYSFNIDEELAPAKKKSDLN